MVESVAVDTFAGHKDVPASSVHCTGVDTLVSLAGAGQRSNAPEEEETKLSWPWRLT